MAIGPSGTIPDKLPNQDLLNFTHQPAHRQLTQPLLSSLLFDHRMGFTPGG
jgi:hypothetical protein